MAEQVTTQQVAVYIDQAQLERVAVAVAAVPHGLPKVLSRAINKVAVMARTRLLKMIVSEINVKMKDIRKKNISLKRASYTKLRAILSVRGNRIPIYAFGARQTKRGVTYMIRKGYRKLAAHSFMESRGTPIMMPNRKKSAAGEPQPAGHRGVFIRTGQPRISRVVAKKTNRRVGITKGMAWLVRPRLPIKELYGPSIPEVVRTAEEFASKQYDELVSTRLGQEIDTQVEVLLKQFEESRSAAPF